MILEGKDALAFVERMRKQVGKPLTKSDKELLKEIKKLPLSVEGKRGGGK